MIANALLATTAIFIALLFFLMGELRFLIPWRDLITHTYWRAIVLYSGLLFVNVMAAVIFIQRKFFLKDAGQKLAHFDKEIHTGEHPLSAEFAELTTEEEYSHVTH